MKPVQDQNGAEKDHSHEKVKGREERLNGLQPHRMPAHIAGRPEREQRGHNCYGEADPEPSVARVGTVQLLIDQFVDGHEPRHADDAEDEIRVVLG
jgi:hypothetical protein